MSRYSDYLEWIDNNPNNHISFPEWISFMHPSEFIWTEEDDEHLSDWDVTLQDGLFDELPINMKTTLSKIAEIIKTVEYSTGDISDIGNEIGWAVGQAIPNINEEDIRIFMIGFKHGISLTNGTHFLGDSWDLTVVKEDDSGVLVSSPNGDTQWLSLTEWELYKINKNKKND